MLNIKLLAAVFVGAAGIKLWADPGRWGIILDVIGALVLSWILFVAVLYLTAVHLRREPEETPKHKTLQHKSLQRDSREVDYNDRRFTRISR